MKKIIIIVSLLTIGVFAAAWFYFRNISSSENDTEKVFNIIPSNASLIFEFKNEAYFYEIFKDFSLFRDVLGDENLEHLNALKKVFVDDINIGTNLTENELFFSLHPGETGNAEILMLAPLGNKQAMDKITALTEILSASYKIQKEKAGDSEINMLAFSNDSHFYFVFLRNTLIGSFDQNLIKAVLAEKTRKEKLHLDPAELNNPRNRNSIARLYVNYPNLHLLLSNFSRRKNPEETAGLKLFPALSQMNINYQSNAFMFSGTSEIEEKTDSYAGLFLEQQPGKSTLINLLPYDASNYLFFFVSDYSKFTKALSGLLERRKESGKKENQLKNIAGKHSIHIEKELPQALGQEFGTFQLATGEKIGLIKSKNMGRLNFLFNTISSASTESIRRFDDSDLLYYYLGDPFKGFKRPYFTIIENHVVVANTTSALNRFLKNYERQDFLARTEKNILFQQYLSNQGNIFYFIHNGNSKGLMRSYLSSKTYKNFRSDEFDWKNIYGLSIQFSADKNKFFTNLFMCKIPEKEDILFHQDSLGLDTLLGE